MFCCAEGNVLTCRVDRMPAVFFIPLGEVGGLVHILDDLSPADSGVVGAEGDLTFLCAVGNHAHLGAAEVVVEKILEPHTFDAEHTPDVVRVVGLFRLHTVVAIGT